MNEETTQKFARETREQVEQLAELSDDKLGRRELAAKVVKVEAEVAELRESSQWNREVGRFLPVVAPILSVLGVFGAVITFMVTQANENRNRSDVQEKEFRDRIETLKREVARPFWDEQFKLYLEAADAAAIIATVPPDSKEWAAAEATFWRLYWGKLAAVEDVVRAKEAPEKLNEVEAAMVAFGTKLQAERGGVTSADKARQPAPAISPEAKRAALRNNPQEGSLDQFALKLAQAIRRQIAPEFDLRAAEKRNAGQLDKAGAASASR